MTKFKRVLSDDDVRALIEWISEKPRHTDKMLMHVEKTILNKLAEQEPVWWVGLDTATGRDYPTSCKSDAEDMASIERFVVTPLYTHPMPCVSPTSDKAACVSESAESETQESAPFTPKTVSEMRSFIGMHFDSLQYANPETEEPDEMDRYTLTIHDLLSAFDWAGHYDCDHIADASKMVTPLAQRKIQTLLDKGEYRVIENATVLVNENGHAAIVNHGGAFYWVDNEALAREFDAAGVESTGENK